MFITSRPRLGESQVWSWTPQLHTCDSPSHTLSVLFSPGVAMNGGRVRGPDGLAQDLKAMHTLGKSASIVVDLDKVLVVDD